MISPVIDNLLIKVEQQTKESYVTKNGLEVFLDPDLRDTEIHSQAFEQIDYRTTSGTVVALPLGYSSPHYFYDRVVKEIEIGDEVHFHYTAVSQDTRIEYNGQYYYAVPYEMVWCTVRNNKITMIGGRVFCEEVYPEDVEEIEVDGHKVRVKMNKFGMVTEMNVGYDTNKAIVKHIGKPLIGDDVIDVKAGDTIYYSVDSDFPNIINGKKYFCMTQEDILAKSI